MIGGVWGVFYSGFVSRKAYLASPQFDNVIMITRRFLGVVLTM